MLKIELVAYVEGLEDLRNLCYFLEGDWTDMCFKVAGRIKAFQDLFPDWEMNDLPSTKVLYKQAIEWALKIIDAGGGDFQLPTPGSTPRNFQTVE